jgi:hypothetical protein
VYNTSSLNDVYPGFYYWNGSRWSRISYNELVFGEIYKTSNETSLNAAIPIAFGTSGVSQNITANNESFLIPKSGIYRVSYAVSVVMRSSSSPSPVTLGFNLREGTGPTIAQTTVVPGSNSHTRVTLGGNSSCSMTKLIHLNEGQRIYLFTDATLAIVYIMRNTAVLNIELIIAD